MTRLILGIDEVGRGPWAGPLVMGGCILPEHMEMTAELEWISDLKDSKKCSRARREKLYPIIKEKSLASATGWVMAAELNKIGLSRGLKLACLRVVENILNQSNLEASCLEKSSPEKSCSKNSCSKPLPFTEIILDGTSNFLKGTKYENVVTILKKADDLIKEVSAASIIAKVEHDHYMFEIDKKYPEYGFSSHVGYGTAKHIAAIREHGITPEHRTFIKTISTLVDDGSCLQKSTVPKNDSMLQQNKPGSFNTTQIGKSAENAVAEYLRKYGHEILEQNFKTPLCEIDIVSRGKSGKIYFTEVKYRRNDSHGSGLEYITHDKLKHMTRAAEIYVKKNHITGSYMLAAAEVSGDMRVLKWVEIK